MKIKDLRIAFSKRLKGTYPDTEVQRFFQMTAQEYLGYSRMDIVMRLDQEVSIEKETQFLHTLALLEDQQPIQYIFGNSEFFGHSFFVSPATLIPRPETEELVQWILDEIPPDARVLDIGTGTGCIAISISKNLPQSQVTAYDVSRDALEVAQKNADHHQVPITFKEVDILTLPSIEPSFDIIVSNPPYVREQEKEHMRSNVLDNEPHLALFVTDTDPLLFYKKIGMLAFDNLSKGGSLYFEINQYLGEETRAMMETIGFKEVILRQDIYGENRMLKAIRY